MSTLPINGKISVNAYACVVNAYNGTSALYCAINNYFCVIRVSFVATSQHVVECAIHHEPGVHEDLHPHMWHEHAKTKAHVHGRRKDFFQGGPPGDFSKLFTRGGKSSEI